MNALPSKLSAVLRVAVGDVAKVLARPAEYAINVEAWHVAGDESDPRCLVCAAGAVMAMTLEVPREQTRTVREFAPAVQARLLAIDSVRRGQVREALDEVAIADDADAYEEARSGRLRSYDSAYDPRLKYDELRRMYGCGLGIDFGVIGLPESKLDLPWMLRVADVLEHYGL